jgi:hypothetical protein
MRTNANGGWPREWATRRLRTVLSGNARLHSTPERQLPKGDFDRLVQVSSSETPRAIDHNVPVGGQSLEHRVSPIFTLAYRSLLNRLAPGSACSTFAATQRHPPRRVHCKCRLGGETVGIRQLASTIALLRMSDRPIVQSDPTAAKKRAPIDSGSDPMSSGATHNERIERNKMTATTCLITPSTTTRTRAFVLVDREISRERR